MSSQPPGPAAPPPEPWGAPPAPAAAARTVAAEMATRTGRRTARHVLVTALLGFGFAFCALVTAASIGFSTGVSAGIVGLLFALVPLGIVVPTLVWVDRFEPEPVRWLLLAFAYGACVATAVSLVVNTGSMAVIAGITPEASASVTAVGVAPLVEESAKGLGLLLLWRLTRDEIDGVIDGIVYAGIIAAGFAFAENILYLGRAYVELGQEGLVATFVVRGLVGPFAHPLFTSCTGIGIGIAATIRHPAVRWTAPIAGWVVAVVLHASWNLTAVTAADNGAALFLVLQVPIFCAYVGVVLWSRHREGRTIERNLQRYADAGWFTPNEVRMLSSLARRRHALAWARAVGGPRAKRAMERFQDEAADLALLRVRLDRGVPAAAGRERELLDAVTALRPVAMAWPVDAARAAPVRR